MDRLLIEELQVQARIGVTPKERSRPQRILVDLELELDLRRAGREDRVEWAVDYGEVARQVRGFLRQRTFHLAEAAAEGVAQLLLDRFQLRGVRARVFKFTVPGASRVGVEVVRKRSARRPGRSRTT